MKELDSSRKANAQLAEQILDLKRQITKYKLKSVNSEKQRELEILNDKYEGLKRKLSSAQAEIKQC